MYHMSARPGTENNKRCTLILASDTHYKDNLDSFLLELSLITLFLLARVRLLVLLPSTSHTCNCTTINFQNITLAFY